MLLAALDLDWQVEEPVYLRPRWDEGGQWVFHFILKHKSISQSCLITIRQNSNIDRLVSEEGLQLDRYLIGSRHL
jgi:hypothetical protein